MADINELKKKNEYYKRLFDSVAEMKKKAEGAAKILFRASGNGNIMSEGGYITEKQLAELDRLQKKEKTTELQQQKIKDLIKKRDNDDIPSGVKTHCVNLFVEAKYKRREDIKTKFFKKGTVCEEDSITLYSRVKRMKFIKNEKRMNNDFVTGEWDLHIENKDKPGEILQTIDTKTSWSAHTFFRTKQKKLDSSYYWQGQTYMWLTGAIKHTVVYCLVNGLASEIMNEKRKLGYELGMIDSEGNESDEYREKCQQIERNHIFDLELFKSHNEFFEFHSDLNKWEYDIPKEDRIFELEFDRNEKDIEKLEKRIVDCRKWMNVELYKLK